MSEAARAKWEARYGAEDYAPDQEPVPFLCERVDTLPVGRALCLAAGSGRNAVFLAERGFAVTAVEADLLSWDFGEGEYDLVTDFYYYEQALFPAIGRALKPGGHFVFQTFSVDQALRSTGPRNRAFMVESHELLAAFAGWRIRYFEDGVVEDQAVVRIVAQKPA